MSQTAHQIIAALLHFSEMGTKPRLIDVHKYIAGKYGRKLETTTISAAIRRDVRPMLATQKRGYWTVDSRQVTATRKVHVYWLRKMTTEEKRQAKEKEMRSK